MIAGTQNVFKPNSFSGRTHRPRIVAPLKFLLVKSGLPIYFIMMKFCFSFLLAAGMLFSAAGIIRAQDTAAVTSAPTYVPDLSHQNEPLPDGVLAWDELLKATDTTNGQDFARFIFSFTNVYRAINVVVDSQITTLTNSVSITNLISVTNSSYFFFKKITTAEKVTALENYTCLTNVSMTTNTAAMPVTILSVHPSCGCTTAELPPVPWTIPPGTSGQIKLAVNLAGKAGVVFKTVNVATDHGKKDLMLRINIAPPPPPRVMSEGERAAAMTAAKANRQAVFKGDCASCHSPKTPNVYGAELYSSICGICHDSPNRATLVPDLHALKVPTNEEFWRTWITVGKPGSVMPAFAQSQGGPLTDLQVASLAQYLNVVIPSHATNTIGQ